MAITKNRKSVTTCRVKVCELGLSRALPFVMICETKCPVMRPGGMKGKGTVTLPEASDLQSTRQEGLCFRTQAGHGRL